LPWVTLIERVRRHLVVMGRLRLAHDEERRFSKALSGSL
jgi:hypothetical protein